MNLRRLLRAIRREPLRRLSHLAWARNPRWRRVPPRVVFIGDSITQFWLDNDPLLFLRGLFDAGIAGETTAGMLARFDRDVIALRPRAVHIMGGTNDLWHGDPGEDAHLAIAHIEEMVARAKAAGIRVILAPPPPISDAAKAGFGHPHLHAPLCAAIEAIARREALVHVDYATSLCGADGALVPAYTTDGVHLTRQGYRAMRRQVQAAIRTALG